MVKVISTPGYRDVILGTFMVFSFKSQRSESFPSQYNNNIGVIWNLFETLFETYSIFPNPGFEEKRLHLIEYKHTHIYIYILGGK